MQDMLFFFQAEHYIRVTSVTGVQTCALPICVTLAVRAGDKAVEPLTLHVGVGDCIVVRLSNETREPRSEERRVGKEWKTRGSPEEKSKAIFSSNSDLKFS